MTNAKKVADARRRPARPSCQSTRAPDQRHSAWKAQIHLREGLWAETAIITRAFSRSSSPLRGLTSIEVASIVNR